MRACFAFLAFALLSPALGEDLAGLWRVEGTVTPGNKTYAGWATLSKKGEKLWEMNVRARAGQSDYSWSGEGTLEGRKLTIARGASGGGAAGALNGNGGGESQTVVYDVAADGRSLTGSALLSGNATAAERYARGPAARGTFTPKELVLRAGETREVEVEMTPADALAVAFVGGARPTHATVTRASPWRVVVTGRAAGTTSVQLRLGTKGPVLASLPIKVEGSVCAQVLERVKALAAAGKKPIVIFDLDDTLFDTRYRTLTALRDYPDEPRLRSLAVELVKHGLPETLLNAGLSAAEVEGQLGKKIRSHWSKHFFNDESLKDDRPIPGSVEFVKALSAAGAHLCYVTGRKETAQALSREVLESAGFPVDDARVTFFLKAPAGGEKTPDFKGRVTRETIVGMGTIVAAFDNEPANSNAFRQNMPADALSVFVDTIYPDDAPALIGGIDTIPDFLE